MNNRSYKMRLIGLDVMGGSFALNMADHRVSIASYNRTASKTEELISSDAAGKFIKPCYAFEDLCNGVCTAVNCNISIPGLMISPDYCDAYRSLQLPVNLIQAQRDYFGAHTYKRIDEKGFSHIAWETA